MKSFFLLPFFFFSSFLSDTNWDEVKDNGVKVIYKVYLKDRSYNDKLSLRTNNNLNKSLIRKREVLERIRFKLVANRELYNFTYDKPMDIDYDNYMSLTGAVSRVIDGDGIYTNIEKNISYLKGFENGVKIDRICQMDDLVWELKNQTKEILGKKCYKAIGRLKNEKLGHSFFYPVIAWYSNELNFSAGPTPFATLPGLILELETNFAIITANSIEINNFNIREYIPKKNTKVMTYPDYLSYMEKWSTDNRQNLRKKN